MVLCRSNIFGEKILNEVLKEELHILNIIDINTLIAYDGTYSYYLSLLEFSVVKGLGSILVKKYTGLISTIGKLDVYIYKRKTHYIAYAIYYKGEI